MRPLKPAPSDWPRLSSAVWYTDAAKAIDWLCDAFGFEVRLKVEGDGGTIVHSELVYGEALIMVAQAGVVRPGREHWPKTLSPKSLGGGTQHLMLFVDDVDAHCAHARAKGATIIDEPSDRDYGAEYWSDRSYGVVDLDGHMWWFTQRLRNPPAK
jgi:uncharacterized glyoxalase superfamily protein PhnB